MDDREASVEALCVNFGYQLRMARLRRRLTIEELAAKAGIPAVTVRRLERGDLPGASIRLIADFVFYLDCHVDARIENNTIQYEVEDASRNPKGDEA